MIEVATLAAALGQGLLTRLGGEAVSDAVVARKDRQTFEEAVERAFGRFAEKHQAVLNSFDVDPAFFQHEGADEIAKVLLTGPGPDARMLVAAYVESLPGVNRNGDSHVADRLEVPFEDLLLYLVEELGHDPGFNTRLSEVAATRGSKANAADALQFLRWMVDKFSYLQTAGIGTAQYIQLPLADVFVGGQAVRELEPGSRWSSLEDQQRALIEERHRSAEITAEEYEAALDRLALSDGFGETPGPEASTPVLDVVRDASRVVVLGDPGAGKTTLLSYLALKHAEALVRDEMFVGDGLGRARFPVYVRIGSFARSTERKEGLHAFIPHYLRATLECPVERLEQLIAQQLRAGRCLVLLDGLDEVSSAADRQQVVTSIADFVTAHRHRGNRFVCTSRISGYIAAPLPDAFSVVRLLEMDDPAIERFLLQYALALGASEATKRSPDIVTAEAEETAQDMLSAFASTPGVRRLATNPLLLTTLLLVQRTHGQLPERRVDAYKVVTDSLGRTWRAVQGVPEAELPDERRLTQWLTRLGDWLHKHRPEGSATIRDLVEVLGPLWAGLQRIPWDPAVLDDADIAGCEAGTGILEFVEQVAHHSGLLVERAPRRWGFPHLTFEEFYAGRALAFEGRAVDRARRFRSRLHDPRYTEPILLGLGLIGRDYPEEIEALFDAALLARGADAAALTLAPSPLEDVLGQDFLFALRALGDDIPASPALVDELLERALDQWLDQAGPGRFRAYRLALAERLTGLTTVTAGRRLREFIIQRLRDGAPREAGWSRRAVELALLAGPDHQLIDVLLEAIGDDRDATLLLADRLAGEGVLPAAIAAQLIAQLQTGTWNERAAAAQRLGEARLDDAALAALDRLATDAIPAVMLLANVVLLQFGGARAENAEHRLIDLVFARQSGVVVFAAIVVLGFDSPTFWKALTTTDEIDMRSPAIADRHDGARDRVLERLVDLLPHEDKRTSRPASRLLVLAGPLPEPLLLRALDQFEKSSLPVAWWKQLLEAQQGLPESVLLELVAALGSGAGLDAVAGALFPVRGALPASVVEALTDLVRGDRPPAAKALAAESLRLGGNLTRADGERLSRLVESDSSADVIRVARTLNRFRPLTRGMKRKLLSMVDAELGPVALLGAEMLVGAEVMDYDAPDDPELAAALGSLITGPHYELAPEAAELLLNLRPLTETEGRCLMDIADPDTATRALCFVIYHLNGPFALDASQVWRLLSSDDPMFHEGAANIMANEENVSDAVFEQVLDGIVEEDPATHPLSWERLLEAIQERTQDRALTASMRRVALMGLSRTRTRRELAARIVRSGPASQPVVDGLIAALRDEREAVRRSATNSLVFFARQSEEWRAEIATRLLAALDTPAFAIPDGHAASPAGDHAYDVIWQTRQTTE
jgi:hypothetical protein